MSNPQTWTPRITGHDYDGITSFDVVSAFQYSQSVGISKNGNVQDLFADLCILQGPNGAPQFVQGNYNATPNSANVSTLTVTFPANTVAGNLILVELLFESVSGSFVSVGLSDSSGNTYAKTWQPSHFYSIGDTLVDVKTGYVQEVTAVTGDQLSSTLYPNFPSVTGNTVSDNHVTWTCRLITPATAAAGVRGQIGSGSGTYSYCFWVRSIVGGANTVTISYRATSFSFLTIVASAHEYTPTDSVTLTNFYSLSSGGADPLIVPVALSGAAQLAHLTAFTHRYFPVPTPIGSPLYGWLVINEPSETIPVSSTLRQQTADPDNETLAVFDNGVGYVQSEKNTAAAAGSLAKAFTSPNTAGNTIVVVYANYGTNTPTISDSQGNTYTAVQNQTFLDSRTRVWIATGIAAGANTVTVNNNGTPAGSDLVILEYAASALDVYDQGAAAGTGLIGTLTLDPAADGKIYATGFSSNFIEFGFHYGLVALSRLSGEILIAYGYSQSHSNSTITISTTDTSTGGLTDQSARLYMGSEKGGSHSFNLQMKQRGKATIPLIIRAGDDYAPTRLTPCYLMDYSLAEGYQTVFSGIIQSVDYEWFGNGGDRIATLTAVTLEYVLDSIVVEPRLYQNQTAGYIFTDLLALASGSPIITGTISAGPTLPQFNIADFPKISDVFTQLATAAGFIWTINPQTAVISFTAQNATSGAFDITDQLWETLQYTFDGRDYRNRQILKASKGAQAQSSELFAGSGQKTFTLKHPVSEVTNAWITQNTQNTATITCTTNPADGDTLTISFPASGSTYNWAAASPYVLGQIIIDSANHIQECTTAGTSGALIPTFSNTTSGGGTTTDNTVIWTDRGSAGLSSSGSWIYTFKTAIDNTQFGQILIGGTAAATALNLSRALNADESTRGVSYSLPTWENPLVNADTPGAAIVTVRNKAAGAGYVAALAKTGTHLTLSAAQTSGGTTTFGTTTISVGVQGSTTSGLVYTPGSAVCSLATPLNSGSSLQIQYIRADAGVIRVENTALVTADAILEHGTGKSQQVTDAGSQISMETALIEAQEALASYSVVPQNIAVQILIPGLFPGNYETLAISEPAQAATLLNGSYVIEEITAELVPCWPSMDAAQIAAVELAGHYRYTIKLINTNQIGSYLDFWLGLGGGSDGGSAAATGAQVAGPSNSGGGGSTGIGGASVKTNDYTALSTDAGLTLIFNKGTAVQLTLPSFPPSSSYLLFVQNIGAGLLTINRNGLNIDGAASNVTVPTGAGIYITTDGSSYYTSRGRASDASLSVSDITTNDVSTAAHGFAPKAPNDATQYLDGTGAYSIPAGGGGGALVLISDQLLVAGALTVTFSSISGSYKHLKIIYQARSSKASADDTIWMQFNGDTAANYSTAIYLTKLSASAITIVGEASAAKPDFLLMTGNTATAGWAASGEIIIPNYAGSTWRKQSMGQSVGVNTSYPNDLERFQAVHAWNNTAAITSIVIGATSATNILTGSRFTLYAFN